MKKQMTIVVLCLIACMLTACAASNVDPAGSSVTPTPQPLVVDLDLSGLSGTFVYAQVYSMVNEYEAWLGKVIKMAGYYSFFEDTQRGVVYHACVIPDATACCAQGIEFIWAGEHAWPADYPEEGADIVVTGRLETYEEDGTLYLHLVDAELAWDAGDPGPQE